jgi:hypothetical protein
LITYDQLTAMRETYDASLGDVCQVLVYTGVQDASGQEIITWEPGERMACGFKPKTATSGLFKGPDQTLVRVDAELRLPRRAHGLVRACDRILLVERLGAAADETDLFELQGEVLEGIAGIVIGLRRVTV